MTLQYCISEVTNPIENHGFSMILPLLNIRYLRIPTLSHGLFWASKDNMLEKGRLSDNTETNPVRGAETLLCNLLCSL